MYALKKFALGFTLLKIKVISQLKHLCIIQHRKQPLSLANVTTAELPVSPARCYETL